MARQVRSVATRRKILDAAIDVFSEVGCTAVGRSAIIERAGTTTGTLYHHFDSMESLTSAVIDEGAQLVLESLLIMSGSSAPALENIVHATFVLADVLYSNKVARVAEQLIFARGGLNEAAGRAYTAWLTALAAEAARAITEGDLREDLDPNHLAESLLGAIFGARLLVQLTASTDLIERLSRMWALLLPTVATESSLAYIREFVAREALRRAEHD